MSVKKWYVIKVREEGRVLYLVYTVQLRHGSVTGYSAHVYTVHACGNHRRAHGVINRHVSHMLIRAYLAVVVARVMALYSCSSLSLSTSSQSSLKRRRQRVRLQFLPFKQRQSRKKALLLISLSVCLVFRLTPQSRSVWTIPLVLKSLCPSTWLPLLFYGRRSQMSPTRSESARLRLAFFVYTGLLNSAVPGSTPVQSVPCSSCLL